MTYKQIEQYIPLTSRLLMALLFFSSATTMLFNFGGTVSYLTAIGIPLAIVILPILLLVQYGGSILIATGIHARTGAWILIIFTALTILLIHIGPGQLALALKNLAIIGGLLMIVKYGSGPFSVMKECPYTSKKDTQNGVCPVAIDANTCTCGVCTICRGGKKETSHSDE